MATTARHRDTEVLRVGIQRWLSATRQPTPRVVSIDHPSDGMSNETLIVTLSGGDGREAGPVERLVLRLPPVHAFFPDVDLVAQAKLHSALSARGVPAPAPVEYVGDTSWLGDPFLVMPYIEGRIPGQAPPFDPWIAGAPAAAQREIEDAFLALLANIHRLDWRAAGLAPLLRGAGSTLRDEVGWWRDYSDWATGGDPPRRLAGALEWCAETCPSDEPAPSLLWGDARLGNVIFGSGRRIVAALDWETACIGPAESDVAWYLAMAEMLRQLAGGATVAGFRSHHDLAVRYEGLLGRQLMELGWHEIFAVVRSICITCRQAVVAAEAGTGSLLPGDDSHPMLPLVESWIGAWQPGSRSAAGDA